MDAAIGLDVGGTKIAAGILLRPEAKIVEKRLLATRADRPGEEIYRDAYEAAAELLGRARALGFRAAGIGIAVPELVDPHGNIQTGAVLDWKGLPIRDRFGRLSAPCVVEADSRAAALGEARFGAGRPYRDFLYVTVGTGIGSAYVKEGRVHPGARGNAGTLASAPHTTLCSSCGAESRSVLEEIASGPALVARYNRVRPGGAARAEDVTAAASRGEPDAVEVVRSAARSLGSGIALGVNLLDPEAVIVGGGLGSAGGLFWDCLVRSVREHVWAEAHRSLPVLPAAFGPDAGLVGAGTAVFEAEGGLPP
jgi:glucokinase